MLSVNWKGKIGYGDIISPICYAHNVSNQLDTKVKLVFHWPHGPSFKQCNEDPETLMERASFIFDRCVKSNVVLEHRYDSILPSNFHHDNYDYTDGLHNFWYSKDRNNAYTEEIVVCGTHHNSITMADYGKTWKDPLGEKAWSDLVIQLSQHHKVVDVSYRTPIQELFNTVKRAKLFIGYHGSVAWVARFLQIPMIVFSSKPKLSGMSFNQAAIKSEIEKDFEKNLSTYIRHSRQKMNNTLNAFAEYRLPPSLVSTFTWT